MFRLIFGVLWTVWLIWTVSLILEYSTLSIESRSEMLGNLRKKIVIDNDTLIIHDYSVVDGTYKLSDGSLIKADSTLHILH